ncbi:hypothetical protein BJ508DRAFT_328550 [Ascobolus immersus RN42]|uniref:Fido domain-containing protein n=1 Tax=Ascobolus immersus RN42 TaxID=1160509 RepID=A0A3N4I124_ASCIM|nr:hypothetical protein BJ508DRAFT_328550 [Ascobolus immersus RN42]
MPEVYRLFLRMPGRIRKKEMNRPDYARVHTGCDDDYMDHLIGFCPPWEIEQELDELSGKLTVRNPPPYLKNSLLIPVSLQEYLKMSSPSDPLFGLELAAWAHCILCNIHPFGDRHNNIVAQMLASLVSMAVGLPPVNIITNLNCFGVLGFGDFLDPPLQRELYLAAMNSFRDGDSLPMIEQFLGGMEYSLDHLSDLMVYINGMPDKYDYFTEILSWFEDDS